MLSINFGGGRSATVFFGIAPRLVPIYSVDTNEKKVAISFDTAWGADKALQYKILGETKEVAGQKANIIAARKDNYNSEKINVLVAALSQKGVEDFIISKYGPTVVYSYKDCRAVLA